MVNAVIPFTSLSNLVEPRWHFSFTRGSCRHRFVDQRTDVFGPEVFDTRFAILNYAGCGVNVLDGFFSQCCFAPSLSVTCLFGREWRSSRQDKRKSYGSASLMSDPPLGEIKWVKPL